MKMSELFVMGKACALDDDSQPYTPYIWMTENGASTDLDAAAVFTSEQECVRNMNSYCKGLDGYFRVYRLDEALKHYVESMFEQYEYHNEQKEPKR